MTNRPILIAPIVFAGLGLAACAITPPPPAPEPPAFVEAACGGCHAVQPPFLSPNEVAPSFAAVANRPGVTRATIQAWLRNAHNYPDIMDFDLTREHVEEVSDYMIALRRRDYIPAK